MEKLRIVERVTEILSRLFWWKFNFRSLDNADAELCNIAFALFFNLSFDSNLRSQMVTAGLLNHVAPHILSNAFFGYFLLAFQFLGSEVALGLLYQLSMVDDAKAIFTFTDSISSVSNLNFKLDLNSVIVNAYVTH
jgi:hypothetical protein